MAFTTVLKLTGLPGESADTSYSVEIDDFSWGEQNGTLTGALTANRVTAQDIKFVRRVDQVSTKLLLACATGQSISQAVISLRPAGLNFNFLTFTLKPCVVASYQVFANATESGSTPEERFSLAFTRMIMDYRMVTLDGRPGQAFTGVYDFAAYQGT